MFERYTPRARRALVLAQEEGRLLGQDFVGSEHILVGLARAEGIAASALVAVGADAEALRRQLRGVASQIECKSLRTQAPHW
jgi:ATP-dependent Clp protease ATP-binding subunit ClpC